MFRKLTEIEIAERVARHAHARQIEKNGDPYIFHVERVVAQLDTDKEKAAGWLHDVIEDTVWTREALVWRAGISQEVAEAVEIVSRRKTEENYEEFIDRVMLSGNLIAIRVKLADLRDHFRPSCPLGLRPRYERAWQRMTGQVWPAWTGDSDRASV